MEFEVDLKVLKALLPLAPKSDIRRCLNGVYVKFEATKTIYVATNGHVLGEYTENEGANNPEDYSLVIPYDTIDGIKLPKYVTSIGALHVEEGRARLVHPGAGLDVGFTPIDGTYPDYKRVMPTGEPSGKVAQFNVEYLYAFGKVNKALGAKNPYSVRVHHNGQDAARVALVGTKFLGIIMPVRD
jgi:DNA polymerase III sliding clamp (beta) subunit (PCNA family)